MAENGTSGLLSVNVAPIFLVLPLLSSAFPSFLFLGALYVLGRVGLFYHMSHETIFFICHFPNFSIQ